MEDAGWRVVVPDEPLCCGLTWISTGQLATAKRVLRRTVRRCAPHVRAGGLVVGLEPSCTAVFRSRRARAVPRTTMTCSGCATQTVTLAELLTEHPRLATAARSNARRPSPRPTATSTRSLGCTPTRTAAPRRRRRRRLDSGCCGLAGNFGFEPGHYEVSEACAERVLLPALREAAPDTVVLADGFSCRTQIHQLDSGGHEAVHLAELLVSALPGAPGSAYGVAPGARPTAPSRRARALALTGAGLAGLTAAAATARYLHNKR